MSLQSENVQKLVQRRSNSAKIDIFFEYNNNEIEKISDNIKLNEYSKNKELKEKLPNNKISELIL